MVIYLHTYMHLTNNTHISKHLMLLGAFGMVISRCHKCLVKNDSFRVPTVEFEVILSHSHRILWLVAGGV